MIRVLAIGECMIELTHRDETTMAMSVGGDTFNTAVYLARLTDRRQVQVDYLTLLGDDRYSMRILDTMRAEGIGTHLIHTVRGGRPGLYVVHTDPAGERTFTYYRSDSPARQLFGDPCAMVGLIGYDMIYLSGITLQILTPDARHRLRDALEAAKTIGTEVVFDSNYRPAGWDSRAAAREAVRDLWSLATIGLPTSTDEQLLFGDPDPAATLARVIDCGVREVAVKDGPHGCLLGHAGATQHVPAVAVDTIVDTTAAGDAFNGAYLAARLTGASPLDAVQRGHTLAAHVIQRPGAIIVE